MGRLGNKWSPVTHPQTCAWARLCLGGRTYYRSPNGTRGPNHAAAPPHSHGFGNGGGRAKAEPVVDGAVGRVARQTRQEPREPRRHHENHENHGKVRRGRNRNGTEWDGTEAGLWTWT